ncbi:peptidase [Mucilaginibacter hurinus]|uniref:Peptidase n=2 Tax=Mucilaginibacter hurinus TaxID=2201324 RepID=A0A367GL36_9SPHI|nr:peptidase [Mucilaginibacter hurinus]
MTITVLCLLLALISYLWMVSKRNKNAPATTNELAGYADLLNKNVDFYQELDDAGKKRFVKLVDGFLQNVHIEGVGFIINRLDKVLVAASAVIPVFGFPGWEYKNLTNVVLYPDTFDHEYQYEGSDREIMGMVGSGSMNGQMLLSRSALLRGFSKNSSTENTGIHEFVHLLDKSDGATDGVPEYLVAHQYVIPWLQMMHREMHRIKDGRSDINPYAVTNEAEFLAVASEYFFEQPERFEDKHPELYKQLSLIFAQDPAANV